MSEYIYIGLLRADGTEPDETSGYCRAIAQGTQADFNRILEEGQTVFPDVTAPGYGLITAAAAWNTEEGGTTAAFWNLPEPVDVHPGVVPVIHKGKLYRGVAVQAEITVNPNALCMAGAM